MSTTHDPNAIPIPESRLENWYDQVVSMQASTINVWRLSFSRARKALVLSVLLNIVFGIDFTVEHPHVQFVPLVLMNGPHGIEVLRTTISELPPTAQVAYIEGLLWLYLQKREHYASSEADESYDIVSTMSDQTVRDQYQRWANAKKNDKAPANFLGNAGWIRIFYRKAAFISHEGDYSGGTYRIDYCKITYTQGEMMRVQPMSAAITYRIVNSIPLLQRMTYNPGALVVTQYPGAEEQAPARDVPLVFAPTSNNVGSIDLCAR